MSYSSSYINIIITFTKLLKKNHMATEKITYWCLEVPEEKVFIENNYFKDKRKVMLKDQTTASVRLGQTTALI